MLTKIKKAYLAGFLDGDGSIYVQAKPNPTYKYGFQIAPYIVLFQSQKDESKFAEICSLIGLGYLRKRNDGILEYIIGKSENIRKFVRIVRPFLILKSDQAKLILDILDKKEGVANKSEFTSLLKLVDRFRELNYSKKRKKRSLTP